MTYGCNVINEIKNNKIITKKDERNNKNKLILEDMIGKINKSTESLF